MFRRRQTPRRLALEVLRTGDADGPDASAVTFLNGMRSLEDKANVRIADLVAHKMQRPQERLDRLRAGAERSQGKKRVKDEDRADRRENMRTWRQVGIRERFPFVDWPPWARVLVLTFLALVDFFVFAEAAAVHFDTESSVSDPVYLFGGLLGLVVYVLGLFHATSLKRMTLAFAQAKLPHPGGAARTSSANLGSVVVTGLMFAMALTVGLFIRLEAGTNEATSAVVFQMLLPCAVVVVEYFLHDPTHVRNTRRTPLDWLRDWRMDKHDRRIHSIKLEGENAFAYNRAFHAEATAILRRLLEDRGLK